MTFPKGQPVSVLCDFDGTATPNEVIGILYDRFASGECEKLVQRWLRAEITTPEEVLGCFATMKATREEMEAVLATVRLDPGFPGLVDFCRRQGCPFAILSDGFQWYINFILERHGLQGLRVFANDITFEPGGYNISFPWYNPATPRRGTSKPTIIRQYQEKGDKVIYIGDGLSDIEAVETANVVYARGKLLNYCQQNEIPVFGFTDITDLLKQWEAV
jgi:2-hydroxy-3-keto-5-methylthiopentenyl-1-phosphate phosphatase